MIAIIDYGVGNLFSLKSSLSYIGRDAVVTGDPDEIASCDGVILPGVGAFGDAAAKLRAGGLDGTIKAQARAGKPLLGICLGMQLLFERGFEYGEHPGLGLIPGEVTPIEPVIPKGYKTPHIGWNGLDFPLGRPRHPLFKYVKEGDSVYFVHSYHASRCEESIIASAEYGAPLTAAAAHGNVCGTQFHPEKSGPVGLNILRAFCEM
ncbi:MAG: imidazole glycerol phosphate synthase subunit HisH [Oscillospiraceae bacterium]|jgi:glutamine amidotransferase|nr:imidazole glycerol phosphate synthase subunit HisH [Oscillospiraceae bacterium]